MTKVNVIRGEHKGQHLYARDAKNGKAEIDIYLWQEYVKALEIINKVEAEVDRQYAIANGF